MVLKQESAIILSQHNILHAKRKTRATHFLHSKPARYRPLRWIHMSVNSYSTTCCRKMMRQMDNRRPGAPIHLLSVQAVDLKLGVWILRSIER